MMHLNAIFDDHEKWKALREIYIFLILIDVASGLFPSPLHFRPHMSVLDAQNDIVVMAAANERQINGFVSSLVVHGNKVTYYFHYQETKMTILVSVLR